MRVFLCAFNNFFLAIPMNSVLSLFLYADGEQQGNSVAYNQFNRTITVSLPLLFNLSHENIRHGIVLQNPGNEDDDTAENKVVLLSTAVECETEIPDEEIFPIPKIFNDTRFSAFFCGMQCADSPVLILNSSALVQYAQKEYVCQA